jgi:broad specificity phosphatase PhoE
MTSRTTTVWLARHGEVHNPRQVLYGRLPRMRLTPQGRAEAQRIAQFLAERPVAAIYSSPLLRARKTADQVLAAHPELGRLRLDADLQEVRTAWQGEPLESLEQIDWDFYANPRYADDESLAQIHRRMQRWLDRILRRHQGGEVVGVSHGDPILILTGALRGLPLAQQHLFPRPYIHTGALYRLTFDASGASLGVELLPQDLELRRPKGAADEDDHEDEAAA